jgi:hypothetical protein
VSVVNLSKPGEDDEEERRRRQEQAGQSDDPATDAAASGVGWCDGCDVPDCDLLPDCDCGGCDFPLLRVSTLLALVALVVPARTGGLVEVLIRGYRRWLTRFTPACPSHPSCSAYALGAVQTLGARRGLRAAARRVRACGREWQ